MTSPFSFSACRRVCHSLELLLLWLRFSLSRLSDPARRLRDSFSCPRRLSKRFGLINLWSGFAEPRIDVSVYEKLRNFVVCSLRLFSIIGVWGWSVMPFPVYPFPATQLLKLPVNKCNRGYQMKLFRCFRFISNQYSSAVRQTSENCFAIKAVFAFPVMLNSKLGHVLRSNGFDFDKVFFHGLTIPNRLGYCKGYFHLFYDCL